MYENSEKLAKVADPQAIRMAILEVANMNKVETLDTSTMRFAAVTFSSQLPVLLTLKTKDGGLRLTVNSEKVVINSMLLKVVKEAISNI